MEPFIRPHEIYGTEGYHIEPFVRPYGTPEIVYVRLYKTASDRIESQEIVYETAWDQIGQYGIVSMIILGPMDPYWKT